MKTWSQQVQNKNRLTESLPSGAAAEPTAAFVFEVGSYPQISVACGGCDLYFGYTGLYWSFVGIMEKWKLV